MATITATFSTVLASAGVRASWDTNPSPKPLKIPKYPKPSRSFSAPSLPASSTVSEKPRELYLSDFHNSGLNRPQIGGLDQQYMGCERWLPPAPKVKKPRSIYNAASLAYIGDCIYELYARRHFLFPPLSINDFNERVMKVVRCESQDLLLKKLLTEEYLTEEERDVLRWGKNKSSNKTKTTRRVGVAIYNSASSLETLIGYLYLTDVKRLEDLMFKLGFSTDASSKDITDEFRKNFRVQ
ncbi:uncharacterized protein LOC110026869 isoform X2 [Phalaenopsis equestris]|uniref:uncharacterized protein LOC110026869 isoform X2 n=1 Tax=Phalaenopsis equestris TaxID=78828 RepID=UPI0009E1D532|nr:uncharacterized protein LOC110026869 isoform X2 [Phalaenopsis equestris]